MLLYLFESVTYGWLYILLDYYELLMLSFINLDRCAMQRFCDNLGARGVVLPRHLSVNTVLPEEPTKDCFFLHQGEFLSDAVSRSCGEGNESKRMSGSYIFLTEVLRIKYIGVRIRSTVAVDDKWRNHKC